VLLVAAYATAPTSKPAQGISLHEPLAQTHRPVGDVTYATSPASAWEHLGSAAAVLLDSAIV
jgi:hypothetical protein